MIAVSARLGATSDTPTGLCSIASSIRRRIGIAPKPVLGRDIGRYARRGEEARLRSGDDMLRRRSLRDKARHECLGHVDRPHQVDRDHPFEHRKVRVGGSGYAVDAGIGENEGERIPSAHGSTSAAKASTAAKSAMSTTRRKHLCSLGLKFGGNCVEPGFVDVGHGNSRTGSRQLPRKFATDAAGCAGHDRGLARWLEDFAHFTLPFYLADLTSLPGAQCNRLLQHFHIYGFAAWEVGRLAKADPVGKKADSARVMGVRHARKAGNRLAGKRYCGNERTQPCVDAR